MDTTSSQCKPSEPPALVNNGFFFKHTAASFLFHHAHRYLEEGIWFIKTKVVCVRKDWLPEKCWEPIVDHCSCLQGCSEKCAVCIDKIKVVQVRRQRLGPEWVSSPGSLCIPAPSMRHAVQEGGIMGRRKWGERRKSPTLLTKGEKDRSHVQAETPRGWSWVGHVAELPSLVQWAASVAHWRLEGTWWYLPEVHKLEMDSGAHCLVFSPLTIPLPKEIHTWPLKCQNRKELNAGSPQPHVAPFKYSAVWGTYSGQSLREKMVTSGAHKGHGVSVGKKECRKPGVGYAAVWMYSVLLGCDLKITVSSACSYAPFWNKVCQSCSLAKLRAVVLQTEAKEAVSTAQLGA